MPIIIIFAWLLLAAAEWLDDHKFLIIGGCVALIALVVTLWVIGARNERKRP